MLYFLYFLLVSINNFFRKYFSLIINSPFYYYYLLLKLLNCLYWFRIINPIKNNISSYNDIFHFNKLKESHQQSVSRPALIPNYKYIPTYLSFLTKFDIYYSPYHYFYFFLKNSVLKHTYFICESFKRTLSFGFYYIRGLLFLLFVDACLTDDEPLWEPIEWSLVQTWILLIFSFAWIAENLIVSRYGSFTGRDKRVWMSWYKTFWLIEGFYAVNYGVISIFIIVPFYFETNYNLSFVYSWWHWYSRVFFFQFIMSYTLILLVSALLQISLRWLNWKKGVVLILFINIFIAYLIYTHFLMVFFGYFTDPIWYQKARPIDYIQLSHEPSRWGWGPSKKDHFTYHNVKTVFWFKNDGPFASSFLLFQLFLFVCLFFLFIFWLSLLRRVWATKELPITFTTYCISSLKQFFYFFLFLYIFVFLSFLINYMRLPWEYYFFLNNLSWLENFLTIIYDYSELFYMF